MALPSSCGGGGSAPFFSSSGSAGLRVTGGWEAEEREQVLLLEHMDKHCA